MANEKGMVISQLKQMKDKLETQLEGVNAALVAFGVEAKVGGNGRTRKAGKARGTPVAAIDAAAVKRGTATPEQIERYNARLAEKAAKGEAKAEKEYAGASLAEAAS